MMSETHMGIKSGQRGLPLWVFGVAGAIVLIQPVSWALSGIVKRSDPKAWMLMGFTIVSVFAYWQSLRWIRFSAAPFMFIFFFLVSYPARVPFVEQNLDLYTIYGGHTSVGYFNFDNAAYKTYYLVAIVGLAGLLFGARISLYLNRRNDHSTEWHQIYLFRSLGLPCVIWAGFSLGVSLICFYLKIGLAGIDQPRLPLHLTGFLNFLRMFILPAAGWFLFGLIYERRCNRLAILFLVFVAMHGIASIYFTLSKAGLMYAIIPLVAYLAMRAPMRPFTWRILFGSAVVMLLLLPITYFGAMVLRDEVYYGLGASKGDELKRVVADHVGDGKDLLTVFQGTISTVASRVTGGAELMGVTAATPYRNEVVLSLLAGKGADPNFGGIEMFLDIYKVQLILEDGKFTGKAFGLFGALFLSHSYLFVFAGSALFAGLVVWLERFTLRHANNCAAIGLAFWIVLGVWEAGFDNLKFYPVILLSMFIVIKSTRQTTRHRLDNSKGIAFKLV